MHYNEDFVFSLFCREDKHRYEEVMHESLEKFMKKLPLLKQQETLKHIYNMYNDPTCIKQNLRYVESCISLLVNVGLALLAYLVLLSANVGVPSLCLA